MIFQRSIIGTSLATLILITLATQSRAALVHRYSFNDASDSIGGATANLFGGAVLSGGALDLTANGPATPSSNPGVSFADLPIGGTIAGLSDASFEAFITYNGGNDWQRTFDFNDNTTNNYIFHTPKAGLGGSPSVFETKLNPGPGVQRIQSGQLPDNGSLQHVVGVIDQTNNEARYYVNGVRVATDTDLNGFTVSGLGNTANNWLGRSIFGGDAGFNGTIDEFRVYNEALSDSAVAANSLAGPDALANSIPLPVTPEHRYSFNGDLTDSVGGANGVLINGNGGAGFSGGLLNLNNPIGIASGGTNGNYIELPTSVIAGRSEVTIEGWGRFDNEGSNWVRIFDFGDQTSGNDLGRQYIFLTPHSGPNDTRLGIANPAGDAPGFTDETPLIIGGLPLDQNTPVHFAAVINDAADTAALYINGVLALEIANFRDIAPLNYANAWLGRALYDGDHYLSGSYDEFRIYGQALTADQVFDSFLAGPDAAAATVPEPTTGLLILLCSAGLIRRRRSNPN